MTHLRARRPSKHYPGHVHFMSDRQVFCWTRIKSCSHHIKSWEVIKLSVRDVRITWNVIRAINGIEGVDKQGEEETVI